jgi:hypothetical protein
MSLSAGVSALIATSILKLHQSAAKQRIQLFRMLFMKDLQMLLL